MTPEQFFTEARSEPFEWERHSCAHLADRWLRLKTGKSFIEAYGADCSTEALAEDLMAQTALPIMVSRAMRMLGFARTDEPRPGDIGVIALGPEVLCSVKGRLWLFRSARGFGAVAEPRVLAAWRV